MLNNIAHKCGKHVRIRLLNILQDSSFSNQRTFDLHIQGIFNLLGRGFRQIIKSNSSVDDKLTKASTR